MDFVSIIALFFIIVPSVAIGVFLNWKQLKNQYMRADQNWYIFKWLVWRVWDSCKRCKRYWASISRNPAIVVLFIAWIFIIFSVWRFSPDLSKLYKELARQILEGGKTDDEYRGIAIRYFGIIAGAGAIIGYIISTARSIIFNNQNKISKQAQITESMVQAIAQIGAFNNDKPNIEVRLGGLYSLQRIMQDSPRDEQAIAKIFYAYIRENAKRDINSKISSPLREDVQAVFDIIGQFNRSGERDFSFNAIINLSRTDFTKYSLPDIDFSGSILEDADLSGADLSNLDFAWATLVGANLSDANLSSTHLINVDLMGANLSGANLVDANLFCADLSNANLSGANLLDVNLAGADLVGANLSNADLSMVKNLTQEDINEAKGDATTKIPEGLNRPTHWKKKKKPTKKPPRKPAKKPIKKKNPPKK